MSHDPHTIAQAALKQSEEIRKQTEESLKKLKELHSDPSMPGYDDGVNQEQPLPHPSPTQSTSENLEPTKQTVKEKLQLVQQTSEQASQVSEQLHSKSKEAISPLEEAEQKMHDTEKELEEKVKGKKSGFTIGGYTLGELAESLIKPPEPSYDLADQETIESLQHIKETKQHIKEAKKLVEKTKASAASFKDERQKHLEELKEITKKLNS